MFNGAKRTSHIGLQNDANLFASTGLNALVEVLHGGVAAIAPGARSVGGRLRPGAGLPLVGRNSEDFAADGDLWQARNNDRG